jgi:hypothetical protein
MERARQINSRTSNAVFLGVFVVYEASEKKAKHIGVVEDLALY